MTNKRLKEIVAEMFEYIYESVGGGEDAHNVFFNTIGLTENEIDELAGVENCESDGDEDDDEKGCFPYSNPPFTNEPQPYSVVIKATIDGLGGGYLVHVSQAGRTLDEAKDGAIVKFNDAVKYYTGMKVTVELVTLLDGEYHDSDWCHGTIDHGVFTMDEEVVD